MDEATGPPKATTPRLRKGTGDIDPPGRCDAFVATAVPAMGESDYLRLGRPLTMLRYTVMAPGGGDRYAYVCTLVPACENLTVVSVCPHNTRHVEAGYAVDGVETWSPVAYREYATESAALDSVKRLTGRPARPYYWTHDQNPWMIQRFCEPQTGDPSAERQYADGPSMRAAPARKPKHKNRPIAPARDDVTDDVSRMIAEGSPDVPAADPTPPTAEGGHAGDEPGRATGDVRPSGPAAVGPDPHGGV